MNEFESKLTSKNTIYLFAFLLTPILIGPYMAFNIWDMGDRKGIWPVIGLSILYFPLTLVLILILPESLVWLSGIFHLAYATFFVEWTWKRYLPTFEEYKSKN